MAITKKDIAREKARKIFEEELQKLANETTKNINFHIIHHLTVFYNKALRITEKQMMAFNKFYEEQKDDTPR